MKKYAKGIICSIMPGIFSFIFISPLMSQHHAHHGHRPTQKKQFEQVATYSGSVTEWTYNDDFVYDGLYLKTSEMNLFVKFPAHLGQQIRSLGNTIIVKGTLRYSPEGQKEMKMISISAKQQTIYDEKPAPRTSKQQEVYVNGNAIINHIQMNKKGDICGYILDNGIILRIAPHLALQLSQIIQIGSKIGYTGIEKELKDGQIQAQKYKIVRCQTISANDTQYMMK